MNSILQALKSRTVLYALVVAVMSVLQAYVFLLPITPVQQMFVGLTLAVGIVVFRYLTTKPVSEK